MYICQMTQALQKGACIRRKSWPVGKWIAYRLLRQRFAIVKYYTPDEYAITRYTGKLYEWAPSREDLGADDWLTVQMNEETQMECDFTWALEQLKAGKRVTRNGWNGKGQWLELQKPDEHSKMTLPYIYIHTVQGDLVPWLASQTDLLAEDWIPAPQ